MFSDRLRMLREDRELMQKDIALKLNIGVTTYNNYEKGVREPDFEVLKLFAKFYEVTTDYLLELTDNPNDNIEIKSDYDAIINEAIGNNISAEKIKEFIRILKPD
jgi:transcriptional regulator with XRE-family HTH domain